jgi:hypothetical protein
LRWISWGYEKRIDNLANSIGVLDYGVLQACFNKNPKKQAPKYKQSSNSNFLMTKTVEE